MNTLCPASSNAIDVGTLLAARGTFVTELSLRSIIDTESPPLPVNTLCPASSNIIELGRFHQQDAHL